MIIFVGMEKVKSKINWDLLGIFTSLACAIHCAILPILLSSLPLFGINIIDSHGFEILMIIIALFVGIYSLSHGIKHHSLLLPVFLFSGGIILLILKQIWHEDQLWFLVPAVLLIFAAHYINYRYAAKTKSRKLSSHS